MKTAKLTRIRNGRGWRYSISICVDIPDEAHPGTGMVALDWGHREHGHPEEHEGLRAWAWLGDDGERGVVILPAEMRAELDRAHGEQSRIDVAWEARRKAQKIPEKSRHRYRSRLDRSGVPTQEEALWLSWETRIERRIAAAKKRAVALRRETYYRAIRDLRQRYAVFAVENLPGRGQQKMDTGGMTAHRKRENRDSVARYEFLSICERFGGTILPVPARNTTRECPDCGHPCEKTSDCVIVCTSCGVARDRDHGATRNILRRGKESLAKSAAMSQNHGAAAE
jgi:transposase